MQIKKSFCKKESKGSLSGNSTPASGYKKKCYICEMIKISVTNIELYSKNYLRFTKILKKNVWSMDYFLGFLIKKLRKKDYSTFVTVTLILSLMLSTVHSILSPALTSNACAMLTGTLVLTELLFEAPLLIVVFCLNSNTITSIFVIGYTYICTVEYIILTI